MANKLVTCRICKTKIDKELAFKVGTNRYYCSEEEYLHKLEEEDKAKKKQNKKKQIKDDTINLIYKLFGYEVTNTALFKELKELDKLYTYANVYSYIQDNFNELEQTIDSKTFSHEFGKIRYFTTIIKNNIVDYLKIKKDEIEEKEYIKNIEYDIPDVKYKTKTKRRALYDIEMELMEEDE